MTSRLQAWLRSTLFFILRAPFRALPMSEGTRDRLRARFLDRFPTIRPRHQAGGLLSRTTQRPLARIGMPAIGHVPWKQGDLPEPMPATVVAFYLPQFHPIPENDTWWGTGFTEWHNVTRALPQFEGHAQPRLPADLGFYDLRTPGIMHRQVKLAREYGIGAFCFYFYWFGGTTLLEAPLRQWLADLSLDLPFCLCWANEPWSRRWDGRNEDILIGQEHSVEDDLAFIAYVSDYLRDPRALKIHGRPVLLVYRPGLLPDPRATADRWRSWCRENGIGEIHLAYVQGFERPDPRDIGFDAAVEFPPNLATPSSLVDRQRLLNPGYAGEVLDWRELARASRVRGLPDYPLHPGVNPNWDNEPRRSGRGRTYLHASPRGYRDWLRDTIHRRLQDVPLPQRLIFVNAWNEWAEGAVLEPDARLGHAYLEATRQALKPHAVPAAALRPCAVIHAWYLDVFDELVEQLATSGLDWRLVVTAPPQHTEALQARLAHLDFAWELQTFENHGRDILPFLHVADRLLNEGVEVLLKLHTKRSPHRDDGHLWRQELTHRLLAPERAGAILKAYADDPTLGLIAPEGHFQPLHYLLGANADAVDCLHARLGLPPADPEQGRFIAGSMFWARTEALRPILDAHLDPWQFEAESGQVDGTFAHAIERVFAEAARQAGFWTSDAASVAGSPAPPSGPYRYAAHR